jgi:hypothetical protein
MAVFAVRQPSVSGRVVIARIEADHVMTVTGAGITEVQFKKSGEFVGIVAMAPGMIIQTEEVA